MEKERERERGERERGERDRERERKRQTDRQRERVRANKHMNMRNNFLACGKVHPVSLVWHQSSTTEDTVDCVDLRLAAKMPHENVD